MSEVTKVSKKKVKKPRSSSFTGTTATPSSSSSKAKTTTKKKRSKSVTKKIDDDDDDDAAHDVEMDFYLMDLKGGRPRRGDHVTYNESDLREAMQLRDDIYHKLEIVYKAQVVRCIGKVHYQVAKIKVLYLDKDYKDSMFDGILIDNEFLLAEKHAIVHIKKCIEADSQCIRVPEGVMAHKLKSLPADIKAKHLIPRLNAIFTLNKELMGVMQEAGKAIEATNEAVLKATGATKKAVLKATSSSGR
jgi:hypothetical protein